MTRRRSPSACPRASAGSCCRRGCSSSASSASTAASGPSRWRSRRSPGPTSSRLASARAPRCCGPTSGRPPPVVLGATAALAARRLSPRVLLAIFAVGWLASLAAQWLLFDLPLWQRLPGLVMMPVQLFLGRRALAAWLPPRVVRGGVATLASASPPWWRRPVVLGAVLTTALIATIVAVAPVASSAPACRKPAKPCRHGAAGRVRRARAPRRRACSGRSDEWQARWCSARAARGRP